MPSPKVLKWMVHGGEPSAEVINEIKKALIDSFGDDKEVKLDMIDPADVRAARRCAIVAAARVAGLWGHCPHWQTLAFAALAYGLVKSPHEGDAVSSKLCDELAADFVSAITG
jgi:hypothetical protein